MELIYNIKSEHNNVYLLNGAFTEKPETVRYRQGEPLYITVLPLSAVYLPYTIKVIDGKLFCNSNLAESFCLEPNRYLIRLKSRSNYVYTPALNVEAEFSRGTIPRFFKLIKQRRLIEARDCLTKELSASIDDEALCGFFDAYIDIAANDFTSKKGWILLKNGGEVDFCRLSERSGLIDNIEIE